MKTDIRATRACPVQMPETPEELFARVQREGLRMPPVEEWETWPFEGEVRPRALQPPVDVEAPRVGEGEAAIVARSLG